MAVVYASRPAQACQPLYDPTVVRRPAFEPFDAVTILGEDVALDCGPGTCTVVRRYTVEIKVPARVVDTDQALHPGDTELRLTTQAALWPYIDECFTPGVVSRHLLLGTTPRSTETVIEIETTGPVRVRTTTGWSIEQTRRPASASGMTPASTRVWFRGEPPRFLHGGPVLLLGFASGDGRSFRLRGSWEAAFVRPWLVFALAADTDAWTTWSVAATAEATSSAWVFPLSLGAGGGLVLTDGTRPGGRGQVSLALGPIRLALSFDVVAPSDSRGVDGSAALWFGGSM